MVRLHTLYQKFNRLWGVPLPRGKPKLERIIKASTNIDASPIEHAIQEDCKSCLNANEVTVKSEQTVM